MGYDGREPVGRRYPTAIVALPGGGYLMSGEFDDVAKFYNTILVTSGGTNFYFANIRLPEIWSGLSSSRVFQVIRPARLPATARVISIFPAHFMNRSPLVITN